MKKHLLIAALLAASFGLNAQSKSSQKDAVKVPSSIVQQSEVRPFSQQALENVKKNDLKVVKELSNSTLKDGSVIRSVQLENGLVRKQLIKATNNKIDMSSAKTMQSIPSLRADGDSFTESFEGWDGITEGWLPNGWNQESKTGETDPHYLWKVSEPGFMSPSVIEGNYYARVQYSDLLNDQDEWLISPKITVKANDLFNFHLLYDIFFARINNEKMMLGEYVFDAMNTYVEFLVSTDDGINWTKEWDSKEYALSFSEDDLWNYVMEFPWQGIHLDASKYAGKDVKLAFRYINNNGESAYLDAVSVGEYTPNPQALYIKPESLFYWGLTENFANFPDNVIFGPAYTPIQWKSYTNSETESVDWSFYSFETQDFTEVVEEENPQTTHPLTLTSSPYLNAHNGGITNSFKWGVDTEYAYEGLAAFGGSSSYEFSIGGLSVFASGNYNLDKGIAQTGDLVSKEQLDTGNETFVGIGNYFEKPLSKYMFYTFYVHLFDINVEPNAELNLTLIRIGEDGSLKDTISTSTIYGSDILRPISGQRLATLKFTFKAVDPETGREEDAYIEIEDGMLAVLTGFREGSITPFVQRVDHEFSQNYAYIIWKNAANETRLRGTSSIFGWYSSFIFGMDITIPYLVTEDHRFEAPAEGANHTFEISDFYWRPENTTGEAQWWFENELPEWITVGALSYTSDTDPVLLPITVAPLPSGEEGRTADLILRSYGCDLKLQVKQGEAYYVGIPETTASNVKAYVNNNNIHISYPEGTTAVSIYNAVGQNVGSYNLNANGTAVLSGANLSKGIYFLKFSGKTNETIKIIK